MDVPVVSMAEIQRELFKEGKMLTRRERKSLRQKFNEAWKQTSHVGPRKIVHAKSRNRWVEYQVSKNGREERWKATNSN